MRSSFAFRSPFILIMVNLEWNSPLNFLETLLKLFSNRKNVLQTPKTLKEKKGRKHEHTMSLLELIIATKNNHVKLQILRGYKKLDISQTTALIQMIRFKLIRYKLITKKKFHDNPCMCTRDQGIKVRAREKYTKAPNYFFVTFPRIRRFYLKWIMEVEDAFHLCGLWAVSSTLSASYPCHKKILHHHAQISCG